MENYVIVLALAGEATARQLARIDSWRRAERRNDERYSRWERVWALLGQVDISLPDLSEPSANRAKA
jgi:ferric-dicitrate binding protein FerR (iron transport regulator)